MAARPDIFLSYKSEERDAAARIVAALAADGFEIWWDQHIGAGDEWRQSISDNLDGARCVLVMWTRQSVGASGRFVQDEASRALRRGTYLGFRLESVEMPIGFGGIQTVDLKDWSGDRSDPKYQALIAAIRRVIAGKPAGVGPTPSTDPAPATAPPPYLLNRRALVLGGVGTIAAAGATFALWPAARCAVGFCPADTADGHSAVAVLPFRAIGGGEQPGYVALGLTEELRGALARLPSIRVAARTSSNALGNGGLDLKEIARKLGVRYILDGSVQGADTALRITATLIRADTGLEEWSNSFDRKATDLLALQSSIATSVAESLRGTLSPKDAAAVARKPTENPQAFDAYIRGQKLLDLASSDGSDRAALAQFDKALSFDPRFASAAAGRARALQSMSIAAPTAGEVRRLSDEALKSAQAAAAQAPDRADVQSTLGYILQNGQLDFPAAGRLYAKSLALAPDDADILIRYGLFNVRVGNAATGLEALRKATRLDPVNPRAFRALGLGAYGAHEYDNAIAAMRQGLALERGLSAGHAVIGDSLFRKGDTAGAIAEYRLEPQDFTREAGLAIALRKAGDAAGAEAAFARLHAIGDGSAYQQAQVLAEWGRTDQAFAMLDLAVTLHDSGIIYVRNDPAFDRLRSLPRFAALLSRLHLD